MDPPVPDPNKTGIGKNLLFDKILAYDVIERVVKAVSP